MKIGVAGPVELNILAKFLYRNQKKITKKVKGLGGSQVTQLVQEYLGQGYKVSVYTLDRSLKENETLHLNGKKLDIFIGSFNRGRLMIFDFMAKERVCLKNFILKDKPDVVHAHWTYEYAQASIESKIPHLITIRDWAPTILKLIPNPYRLMRYILNNNVIKKSKTLVANSPYIAKKIKKIYNLRPLVIPNGISNIYLKSKPKKLNVKLPVIISITNGFGKLKNIKSLIKAQNLLTKNFNQKIKLKLVGQDMEKGGLAHKWVIKNDLNLDIAFLGLLPRKKVINELSNSDIMVHPSLEESFGNTLLESMACKVPVIAGNKSGATAWLLNYGKVGKTIDVKKPENIAKAVYKVLKNESTWKRYSIAGYHNVKNNFLIRNIAKKYLICLKKVLEKKSTSGNK